MGRGIRTRDSGLDVSVRIAPCHTASDLTASDLTDSTVEASRSVSYSTYSKS